MRDPRASPVMQRTQETPPSLLDTGWWESEHAQLAAAELA